MTKRNQVPIIENFSGEKRLETAFRLSAMVRELALAGIKRQYPKANKKEIISLWVKGTSLPY